MMDMPNFEAWWEEHGQYGRAGGGEYEKTFAYNAWVSQAERIRVLREALEKTMNYASCDYGSSFRPHFEHVMKRARAALEATK